VLEDELRAHVSHLARGVPAEMLLDARELELPEVSGPRPLPETGAACELGRLALELGGLASREAERALAARLLESAAREGTPSAACEAALAESRALRGDAQGAQRALQAALARAPDDAGVRGLAGRAELARAESADGPAARAALAAAEGHFRVALSIDEESAAGWFGLGRSLDRAGDAESAREALTTARRFGWSPELDLELGRLELARGHGERAFELLWPLAQDPHAGPIRDAAAELLERGGLAPKRP
jgi:Flp pilus assembly protein TadD